VYSIQPPGATAAFPAYCDMSGGGWTVIQRRMDGSVDFYRGWADYVAGFGELSGNFWAGLDNIHAITTSEPYVELMVTMETFEGESAMASYCSFSVGDAASGYVLSVSGYSGNAGDSMTWHSGQRFSTFDNDQDKNPENCALAYRGAWWYNNCHMSNPNGLYLNGLTPYWAQGVVWSTFRDHTYSLKAIEFKVRRVFG
jgi:ficolin